MKLTPYLENGNSWLCRDLSVTRTNHELSIEVLLSQRSFSKKVQIACNTVCKNHQQKILMRKVHKIFQFNELERALRSDLGVATKILELKAGLDNEKVLPFTRDYLRGIDEEYHKEAGLAFTWASFEAKSARKWLFEQEFQKTVERGLTKQGVKYSQNDVKKQVGELMKKRQEIVLKRFTKDLAMLMQSAPHMPTQFLQRFKAAITQDTVDLLMKEALKFRPKDGECVEIKTWTGRGKINQKFEREIEKIVK